MKAQSTLCIFIICQTLEEITLLSAQQECLISASKQTSKNMPTTPGEQDMEQSCKALQQNIASSPG